MKIYDSFELLEKIRVTKTDNNRLSMNLKNGGGLYCIWLKDVELLKSTYPVIIQGPSTSLKTIKDSKLNPDDKSLFRKVIYGDSFRYYAIHKTIFDLNSSVKNDFIPVYIGKSTNVKSRIRQHIMPSIKSRSAYLYFKERNKDDKPKEFKYRKSNNQDYVIKRNSSSQFRAGIEYIFRSKDNSYAYDYIWEKVYLSVIYEDDFKSRFYSENLLIGKYLPMFNLDGER